MNILSFHQQLIAQYRAYIESFINIKDEEIRRFVLARLEEKKLWPEPLIQFNPTFEKCSSFVELIAEGLLHPACKQIFSRSDRTLYRHQEEAIRLGAKEQEFIVTSGTGSGKSLT